MVVVRFVSAMLTSRGRNLPDR